MARRSRGEAAADPLDRLFYAISDPTRRHILSRLTLGPARVTDLAKPFRMSLPAVSKHLRILEEARLVSRRIQGRVHCLALRGRPLQQVETWLDPFRPYWEDRLSALGRDLEQHPSRRSRGSSKGILHVFRRGRTWRREPERGTRKRTEIITPAPRNGSTVLRR
jgi:DNA-binding transcriptional ArsR family regulator